MTRGGVVRIVIATGLLRVIVCPLCAALVLADGARQHERVRAATWPQGDRPMTR